MQNKNGANHDGFTFIEVLVTLMIVSILMLFTISGFKTIFKQSSSDVLSSQLMRAIHLARFLAMKQDSLVTMCKSRDQKTCSGDWQDGYLLSSNNKILFSFHNNNQGVLHWRAFPYFLDHLEFLASGLPNFQNGTFWYCLKSTDNPAWAIMISQSGRARLVLPDELGVIKDDKDKALSCQLCSLRSRLA